MLTRGYELGGYVAPAGIIADAAVLLEPPEYIAISDWAESGKRVLNRGGIDEPFSFDAAPYLREPQDMLGSTAVYRALAIKGCAQSGKTELYLNWIGHTVECDPADMIVLHPDKLLAREFMVSRVGNLVEMTEGMAERFRPGGDNTLEKRFIGCNVWGIWPVGAQLRQRPVPRTVVDDLDDVPEDIDGQGSAQVLIEARQTSFEGREKAFYASSPALGKGRGIAAIYDAGTRKRWHWPCPHCGATFTPEWGHVHVKVGGDLVAIDSDDAKLSAAAAKASAVLVCPVSGCVIEPRHKMAMNRAGRWAGPLQHVDDDGAVIGPELETSIASYHIHGLMGFSSWGRLAELYVEARDKWRNGQNENDLRAFFNARLGLEYRSQVDGDAPLTADDLDARRDSYAQRTVPAFVKVLIAAVDVQGDRFEVLVVGYGDGLESAVIDRFAILETEDGRRVRPGKYPEHWGELLKRVMSTRWKLADDPELDMPVLATAIDTGGEAGVSDNAKKFWYLARQAGLADKRITLVKGSSHKGGKILPSPTYLETIGRGRIKKNGAKLFVINTHELKDIVDARLRRAEPGPGYIHLPAGFDAEYLDELTAEEKQDGNWEKIRERNETLDLTCYAIAALMRFAGERYTMHWVPAFARRPVRADDDDAGDDEDGADAAAAETENAHDVRNSADNSDDGQPRRRRRRPRRRAPAGPTVS